MDIPHLKNEILKQLPSRFCSMLDGVDFSELQEIRFRCSRPIMLHMDVSSVMITERGIITKNKAIAAVADASDISSLMSAFCENSVYAYQNEICDGFLTIRGGHRVGISGRCVIENGRIVNIADISGLNLRIAKEFIGCAENVFSKIAGDNKSPLNTILLAPPQCGKTTLLRDLARIISSRRKVTIIDERSELAAVKSGIPQFDVGIQTDVLDRFPKPQGMLCAVRSLSPEVIITDEIGNIEDIAAVKSVLNSGCRIITSMHADSCEELTGERRTLFEMFDCAVLLTKKNGIPIIKKVFKIGGEAEE